MPQPALQPDWSFLHHGPGNLDAIVRRIRWDAHPVDVGRWRLRHADGPRQCPLMGRPEVNQTVKAADPSDIGLGVDWRQDRSLL
jgi:hypothetical protein